MTKKEKELSDIKIDEASVSDEKHEGADASKLQKKIKKLEKSLQEAEEAVEKLSAEKDEYIGFLQKNALSLITLEKEVKPKPSRVFQAVSKTPSSSCCPCWIA